MGKVTGSGSVNLCLYGWIAMEPLTVWTALTLALLSRVVGRIIFLAARYIYKEKLGKTKSAVGPAFAARTLRLLISAVALLRKINEGVLES